jgi:hypothetical protein
MQAPSTPIHEKARNQLLREVVEALMWELNAVRTAQWDQLPEFSAKKQMLLVQMEAYDWTPNANDRDNLEGVILKSQIIDLEYQVRKHLENNLEILKLQLTDLHQRHQRWKSAMMPYLQR